MSDNPALGSRQQLLRSWGRLAMPALAGVLILSAVGSIAVLGLARAAVGWGLLAGGLTLALWPKTVSALFLALLPFQYFLRQSLDAAGYRSLGTAVQMADEAMGLLLAGYAMALMLVQRRTGALRLPATLALGAFAVAGVVSALVNANEPLRTALGIHDYMKSFLFFYIFSTLGYRREEARRLVGLLVLIAVAASAVAAAEEIYREPLTQWLHGHQILTGVGGQDRAGDVRYGVYRVSSFLGHPNSLANYLVLFILLVEFGGLDRKNRLLRRLLLPLFLGVVAVAFSRQVWMSLVAAYFLVRLMVFRQSRNASLVPWLSVAGLAVMVWVILGPGTTTDYFFSFVPLTGYRESDPDLYVRWYWTAKAFEVARDHPFWGSGPGTFGGWIARLLGTDLYLRYRVRFWGQEEQSTVDTLLAQVVAEMGLVGSILFAASAFLFVRLGMSAARAARERGQHDVLPLAAAASGQIASLSINSLFGPTFSQPPTTITAFALLGVVWSWSSSLERPGAPGSPLDDSTPGETDAPSFDKPKAIP